MRLYSFLLVNYSSFFTAEMVDSKRERAQNSGVKKFTSAIPSLHLFKSCTDAYILSVSHIPNAWPEFPLE